MKGNFKQRIFAIALCIAMFVTSINLTELINNDINAASLHYQSGYIYLDVAGLDGTRTVYKLTNWAPNMNVDNPQSVGFGIELLSGKDLGITIKNPNTSKWDGAYGYYVFPYEITLPSTYKGYHLIANASYTSENQTRIEESGDYGFIFNVDTNRSGNTLFASDGLEHHDTMYVEIVPRTYPVSYIDVIKGTSTILGRTDNIGKSYNSTVSGSDRGTSTTIGAYYTGYIYYSSTSATVGTSGATVYRYFIPASYVVTYVDRIAGTSTNLGTSTAVKNYGDSVSGADKGTSTSIGAYHAGYRLTSYDSSKTVTGDTIIYRYFTKASHDVTCLDYLTDKTTKLGTAQETKTYNYGSTAKGSDWGTSSPYNNAQYTYTYNSCSSVTVDGTETVYRYWTRTVNPYNVTCVDYLTDKTTKIGTASGTKSYNYGSTAKGSDWGTTSPYNNTQYTYTYNSCTTTTVNGNTTVYRYWTRTVNPYKQIVQVRFENADGTFSAYQNVINENRNYGTTVSWSRPADVTYKAASITSYTVTGAKTTQVTVYRNNYPITCIDVIVDKTGKQLGKSTWNALYGSTVSGATKGTDKTIGKYYTGFYYDSCSEATVTENGATIYRFFKSEQIDLEGTINWVENGITIYRPETMELILYQNNKEIDRTTINTSTTNYGFNKVDRYDKNGNLYSYTVKQVFENVPVLSWNSNIKDYEEILAYTSTQNGYNFVNTLNNIGIPVKPEYTYNLTLGLEFDNSIDWDYLETSSSNIETLVTLKRLVSTTENGTTTYSSEYDGMMFNAITSQNKVTISNLPSGKYEIIVSNKTLDLDNITTEESSNISISKENGKYYLVLNPTIEKNNGNIIIKHIYNNHYGYISDDKNLYK